MPADVHHALEEGGLLPRIWLGIACLAAAPVDRSDRSSLPLLGSQHILQVPLVHYVRPYPKLWAFPIATCVRVILAGDTVPPVFVWAILCHMVSQSGLIIFLLVFPLSSTYFPISLITPLYVTTPLFSSYLISCTLLITRTRILG